jgi:hypothetical protein
VTQKTEYGTYLQYGTGGRTLVAQPLLSGRKRHPRMIIVGSESLPRDRLPSLTAAASGPYCSTSSILPPSDRPVTIKHFDNYCTRSTEAGMCVSGIMYTSGRAPVVKRPPGGRLTLIAP